MRACELFHTYGTLLRGAIVVQSCGTPDRKPSRSPAPRRVCARVSFGTAGPPRPCQTTWHSDIKDMRFPSEVMCRVFKARDSDKTSSKVRRQVSKQSSCVKSPKFKTSRKASSTSQIEDVPQSGKSDQKDESSSPPNKRARRCANPNSAATFTTAKRPGLTIPCACFKSSTSKRAAPTAKFAPRHAISALSGLTWHSGTQNGKATEPRAKHYRSHSKRLADGCV